MKRPIRYLSVCSGIEAASVAWHPLGWEPVAFAEIDPFASAVLAHRFPNVRNLGDITQHASWNIEPGSVDVLVGGTPCQSFSVAGLRGGLSDPRGNLALVYLAIVDQIRPRYTVWENVPGVLSSNGGRDFGSLLGGLAELGYGFAYRVLDAQFVRVESHARAVPQRRRRVFAIGCAGADWERAAEVLALQESLPGDPPARRKARQGATEGTARGAVTDRFCPGVAGTPGGASQQGGFRTTDLDNSGAFIVEADATREAVIFNVEHGLHASGNITARDCSEPITASEHKGHSALTEPAPTMRAMGHHHSHANGGGQLAVAVIDVVPDRRSVGFYSNLGSHGGGTGEEVSPTLKISHNTGAVPVAAAIRESGKGYWLPTEVSGTIDAHVGQSGTGAMRPAVVFSEASDAMAICEGAHGVTELDVATTLAQTGGKPGQGYQAARINVTVRRLTPRECERLQGFPDDWTLITVRGKPAADGSRYKVTGNSMAVNVMRWIGDRIAAVDAARRRTHPLPATTAPGCP